MCGIVGVIGHQPQEDKIKIINKMNHKIIHRGPDDFGVWANDSVGFGMRRLSIVDLNGGHQPIWFDSVGIVFNGEVYNHKTLRLELEENGYFFDTESDTEVILKSYCFWGQEFINKIVGMFAICIVDLKLNKTFIARDHLGIKPLYLTNYNNSIFFASEIKSFKDVTPLNKINFDAINDYLTFRYIPSSQTSWLNVTKVKPGTMLIIDLETQHIEQHIYWKLDFSSVQTDSKTNYIKQFDELFTRSVAEQLAADVPVGAFLSGGLDSTIICAKAKQLSSHDFHTFSVAFEDGQEFSELSYAALAAKHIGTIHHEIIVTKDMFMSFLENQPFYSDDPLADLTSVPLYYLSLEARKHVKVALSGEGADELFAGYDLQYAAERANKRAFTKLIPQGLLTVLSHISSKKFRQQIKLIKTSGWGGYVAVEPEYISKRFSSIEKSNLWTNFKENYDSLDIIRHEYSQATSPHPIDKIQQVLSGSWLVEDLLAKADKMSMAASLEVRVPFLDHRLAEWAMSLPIDWKTGNSSLGYDTKRILREAARGFVPTEILNREKRGFSTPLNKWLESSLGKEIEAKLLQPGFIDDWFNRAEVAKICREALAGSTNQQRNLWVIYVLGLWKKNWFDL